MRKTPLALLFLAITLISVQPVRAENSPVKKPWVGQPSDFRVPIYHFPKNITLCGEKVPFENHRVWEMMDREFQINVYDRAQVIMWAKRAKRYFPHIEAALRKAGMPDDLKYLAVAESALKTYAWSSAGAAGAWQFIRSTGRRYGLRRNTYYDERLDFEKATNAALRYLKDLHGMFGKWTLAMAAYNCGEDRVKRELAEQGVNDYFYLNLPIETERYIFRILTAKVILSNLPQYGYHLDDELLYEPIPTKKMMIRSKRPIHFRLIAAAAGSYYREIKELNPGIRGYKLPAGNHRVVIPSSGAPGFDSRLAELLTKNKGSTKRAKKSIPAKSQGSRVYVVRKGDTLSGVADKLKVSMSHLKRRNSIKGDVIMIGQKLRY